MNYVTSIFTSVKGYYDGINGATLSGALDVIVVKQPDGSFSSSPFHVRFGKLNVLQSNERLVELTVNGRPVSLQMRLGANGEAFFLKQVYEDDEEYPYAEIIGSEYNLPSSPSSDLLRLRQESTALTEDEELTEVSDNSDINYQDEYTGDDCLSDSELYTVQQTQHHLDHQSNRIVWNWGSLPSDTAVFGNRPSTSSAEQEETRGMWEVMGQRRMRKNTYSGTVDLQEGMFLDDIDTNDPYEVAHYFGVPAYRSGSRRTREEDGIDRHNSRAEEQIRMLDALSLEAPRYPTAPSNAILPETAESECGERSNSLYDETIYDEEDRRPRYTKKVRLSTEEIEQLELESGPNVVTFSVTTRLQGTTRCTCTVYLWDHTDKVIISDIDGTITRSDVFGHILPWVGKDWTQNNIAKLFTAIENNGYKFLYLSSRAIGQASMTKSFLKSIKQNGVGIPEGPMLLSPDSLLRAIKDELVLRQPHIFKIKCLMDIKNLFGKDASPFYAGFGNRVTDSKSYQAVNIPPHRVFIINHRGEIYTENSLVQQHTYQEIYEHHEVYFPSCTSCHRGHGAGMVEEDFLTQNFWKMDFVEIDESELA